MLTRSELAAGRRAQAAFELKEHLRKASKSESDESNTQGDASRIINAMALLLFDVLNKKT